MFFPLTLAVSGLERHLGKTVSIALRRGFVFFVVLVWSNLASALQRSFSPRLYVLNIPQISNVQRQSRLTNIWRLFICSDYRRKFNTITQFSFHETVETFNSTYDQ